MQQQIRNWTIGAALVLLSMLLLVAITVGRTTCAGLDTCDPFKVVCASARSEHQFFYSECDMVRENCLTGANWKHDRLHHCNVNA